MKQSALTYTSAGMWALRPDRVEALMLKMSINQSQLGDLVGLSQPSIGRILSGETKTSRQIRAIARVLDTTPEYLMGETDNPGGGSLTETRLGFQHAEPELPDNAVQIPQLEIGYSMGGGSVFADYQQTAMVPFPRQWLAPMIKGSFADLFVARGEGDSMLPTLLDGDLVIVDTAQKNVRQQDRLWCLSYGDLGMIKRVRMLPDGGLQINSDNPAVTPIVAHDGEVHVIGRVIWIGRRV